MNADDPLAYRPIADLLTEVTGMVFREARLTDVATASRKLMHKEGIRSVPELGAALRARPALLDELVSALVVPETYFFRDLASIQFLRDVAIPALLEARPHGHRLRLWSAGCSTGEEPYTLAMLLDEMGLLERASILATDLSPHAISKARAARYRPWSFRGESGARARRWVEPDGDDLVVTSRIRSAVRFEALNLASDAWPSEEAGTADVDLLLCRNVLIYLEPSAIRAIAQRLYESLAPRGWLLTAAADPLLVPLVPLRPVVGAGIAYCKLPEGETDQENATSSPPVFAPRRPRERVKTRSPSPHPAPFRTSPRPASTPAPMAQRQQTPTTETPTTETPTTETPRTPTPAAATPPPTAPTRAAPAAAPGRRELVDRVRAAFEAGRYDEVITRVGEDAEDADLASLVVRALANKGQLEAAEARSRRELQRHSLSVELRYVRALLLLAMRKPAEAVEETRRLLYLSPDLAVGHLLQGRLLLLLSDEDGARRAFRNASARLTALPDDAPLELGEGQTAGQTREAAQQVLRTLGDAPES